MQKKNFLYLKTINKMNFKFFHYRSFMFLKIIKFMQLVRENLIQDLAISNIQLIYKRGLSWIYIP